MKKIFYGLVMFCLSFAGVSSETKIETNDNITVMFKVIENDYNSKTFQGQFIITNSGEQINNWKLCFNLIHPLNISEESIFVADNTLFNHDDYHEITGLEPIKKNGSITINISGGNYCIEKYSDCPGGYFIVINETPYLIAGESDLSAVTTPPDNTLKPSNALASEKTDLNLIPVPGNVKLKSGTLDLSKITSIINTTSHQDYLKTAEFFLEEFKELIARKFSFTDTDNQDSGSINLIEDTKVDKDGFKLIIDEDKVSLYISSKGGIIYGLGALLQLDLNYAGSIPTAEIIDSPRFQYRGVLFDPARCFIPSTDLKKYIKIMSLYRLNVLHLHLTDSEGWRIEIEKYKNLTNIGAYRGYYEIINPSRDSGPVKYGGFYTKDDIKDVIEYANKLNITVFAEVDTPGHSTAFVKSFDNYKSTGNNPLVDPKDKSTLAGDIINPAVEKTYEVLNNVFADITEILNDQRDRKMPFSEYVGIGGDEVPSYAWSKSPMCKELMSKLGISTTNELQNYFMNRVAGSIKKSLNYNVFVWQEALKGGGMDKETTLVFSWLEADTGLQAAKDGYKVVLAPQQNVYFDHAYNNSITEPGFYGTGYVDAKMVYSYKPIPGDLTEAERNNIQGVQGCLWGDELLTPRIVDRDKYPANYLKNPIDYMGFPKMTALSELAWSAEKNRNWDSFLIRLHSNLKILKQLDVYYRTPDYTNK